MADREEITIEEFNKRLGAQGVEKEFLTFRCPMCGTIQCAQDLINAGAGKNMDEVADFVGFSCVGRWTHHLPPPKKPGKQIGCNWTLGGLFQLHKLAVIT
ncbi:MAG: VVA0879 family protein, partial [Candidatus Bathyarchaeia archaeon]